MFTFGTHQERSVRCSAFQSIVSLLKDRIIRMNNGSLHRTLRVIRHEQPSGKTPTLDADWLIRLQNDVIFDFSYINDSY